jgi:hypothetical protein
MTEETVSRHPRNRRRPAPVWGVRTLPLWRSVSVRIPPTLDDPSTPVTSDAPRAGSSITLEPPRPSDEHISACNWCWSYWEHSLAADRWMPSGERPQVIGDGPPCPHCDRTAYQLRRFLRGKAPQRLELAICFGCGHVRGLTEGREADLRTAPVAAQAPAAAPELPAAKTDEPDVASPADPAEEPTLPEVTTALPETPVAAEVVEAGAQRRFVRYPGIATDPASTDEDDADPESGFRSLEPWEVAAFLAWIILALLILNAWIWWHRAQDAGLI